MSRFIEHSHHGERAVPMVARCDPGAAEGDRTSSRSPRLWNQSVGGRGTIRQGPPGDPGGVSCGGAEISVALLVIPRLRILVANYSEQGRANSDDPVAKAPPDVAATHRNLKAEPDVTGYACLAERSADRPKGARHVCVRLLVPRLAALMRTRIGMHRWRDYVVCPMNARALTPMLCRASPSIGTLCRVREHGKTLCEPSTPVP